MKSLIKKATISLFVFSSIAVAASLITKEEVNQKVEQILAPFNNASSVLAIQFSDLNVDTVRALDFGLNALIAKKGPENNLVFKIQNASYHYGNGFAPTVKADVSLQLDLVKALGQNTLNELSVDLEEMVTDFVSRYSRRYGKAVTLDVGVEELNRDAQGNFESAKLHLYAKIDLKNLPENLKVEDVELKGFKVLVAANKVGVKAKATVVLNPKYRNFEEDQPGLKEYIEKLLSEDAGAYQEIYNTAEFLDKAATDLVTQNRNQ